MNGENPDETRLLRHLVASWRTNLRLFITCLGCFVVGGITVLWASGWAWSAVGVAFGSGVTAVAALALVSEVFLRRRLVDEVLAAVDIREEVARADIVRVLSGTMDFQKGFADAIRAASTVDIMFISASSWVDNHRAALSYMLARGGRLRVLVPSPSDALLLDQLLTRFNYVAVDDLAMDIQTTVTRLRELQERFQPVTKRAAFPDTEAAGEQAVKTEDGARHALVSGVSVRRLSVVPTYSLYRMDDAAVMRVHEVRKERADETPVVVFGSRGSFWRFATIDFDTLFDAAEELA